MSVYASVQRGLVFFAVLSFLVAWILPNHYRPWGSAYQEFASFFAALLLLVALFLSRKPVLPSVVFGFFFVALIPLLQWAAGIVHFAGDAWMAATYVAGFAAMLMVGFGLREGGCDRRFVTDLLAGVLIVGAVLSGWIALRQWLSLSGSIWVADLPPGGRPFANLAQPNNLASLLCMGLCGVLYFYERYKIGWQAAGLVSIFLLFCVALTQSRTPWVIAVAVGTYWFWKARSCQLRLSPKAVLAWLLGYALCVAALPWLAECLLLSDIDLVQRAQSVQRLAMWEQLWFAVLQGPMWGYGWGQVSVAQVSVTLDYPVPIMTEHSHNIILDLLIWNGPVLGGVIVVVVFGWLLSLFLKAGSVESIFAMLVVGVLLVHGLLEFPLEYAFFLFPVGLLLGGVVAEHGLGYELEVPRWFLGGGLALAVGMFVWVWQEYRLVAEDYSLMRFETARIGELKAVQPAPDVVLLTQLREFTRFARSPAVPGMSQQELDWMRKVSHRYPYYLALYRYGLALALNGENDMSREQFLVLRGLYGERRYAQVMEALRLEYPEVNESLGLSDTER